MPISQFLGDGVTHKIKLTYKNAAFNPTGFYLLFTVKANPTTEADSDAVIQKASGAGIVPISTDGINWYAEVTLLYADTASLPEGDYFFDIQAQADGESPKTIAYDRISFIRDVTRNLTSSVPIITTEPPIWVGAGYVSTAINDAMDAHLAAVDPHPQYAYLTTVNAHISNTSNPHSVTKAQVGLGNVDNTSDANKPISTATQTALNGKEPSILSGTTGQYWRGDKTWQTHDKASVGLGNVDNTSDANKPISTSTQTALNLKANSATTLAGYGITDAYTKTATDTLLSAKADASATTTALAGKQPLDADLTAIAALAGTSGLLKKTAADTWALDTSTYLTGNQTITVSGDASGSGTNAISLTLANVGTAGTYRSVTTDAKGRVTAGTNPTTVAGYGITDVYTKTEVDTADNLRMLKSANLSDVSSASTSRTNLGVYSKEESAALATPRPGLVFDGTGSCVIAGSTPGTGDFAFVVMASASSYGTNLRLIGLGASYSGLFVNASGTIYFNDGASDIAFTGATFPLNTLNTVALTRSGSSLSLSVNAGTVYTVTNTTSISQLTRVGASGNGANQWSGTIRGLYVYNRALSAAEVQSLAQTGVTASTDFNKSIAGTTVTAGSFIAKYRYRIVSIGTTDFTLIGAASNTVGLEFIATGAGTNTGTALALGLTCALDPMQEGYGTTWNDVSGNKADATLPASGVSWLVPAQPSFIRQFNQTADVTVANTTTETTILGAGSGSLTIPANVLRVGSMIRGRLKGQISTTGNPNSTWSFKIGTSVLTTTASSPGNNLTSAPFEIELMATVRTIGTSGTIVINGMSYLESGTVGAVTGRGARSGPIAIDTTTAKTLNFTYTWATAATGNTITCEQAQFEILP